MSFTADTKAELSRVHSDKKCCQLAEIAGFMRFAGSITLNSGKLGIKLTTDSPAVARAYISLIKDYFGAKTALSLGEPRSIGKGKSYVLDITPEMNAEQILREVGIIAVREGNNYITDGINQTLIRKRCCRKAFLRGIFMAAGSVTDPVKSYHMEISCDSQYMARDVSRLINSFGLQSRITQRRTKHVIYIKDGDQIGDFFAAMGAGSQLLKYQNVRITKENRNQANRIVNCESANLDKTVAAAGKQLSDIKYIADSRGLQALDLKLKEAAVLRMENPDLPLSELCQLFTPPLSKAGLNHRLRKISEFAQRLRES